MIKHFLAVLFYVVASMCLGGKGYAQQEKVYFDLIDIKSGLPESSVRDMKEDALGYIWMATQNGLVRYDGYNYKVYNLGSEKVNIESFTNVTSLFLDKKGTLWASTISNGIFKYDRRMDAFAQYIFPLHDGTVVLRIYAEDKTGSLWGIAYLGDKTLAWKLDSGGHFELFGEKGKGVNHISATVNYVANTSTGTIWLGTTNGIYRYDGKDIGLKGFIVATDTLKRRWADPIYEAPSEPGILWMNTYGDNNADMRLTRFDTKTNTQKDYLPSKESLSLRSGYITGIYEDKKQQLWLTTSEGLSRMDRKAETFTNYVPGAEFASSGERFLHDIKETKDGNFWVTGRTGIGLFRPDAGAFDYYLPDVDRPGSISSTQTVVKMLDSTDVLWIGYGWGGANRANKKKSAFKVIKQVSGKADSYPGKSGRLMRDDTDYWFSNKTDIYKWDPKNGSFRKAFSADPDDEFLGIPRQANGNLYIPTKKGLQSYNIKTGKKALFALKSKEAKPRSYVFQNIFKDHTGIFWLGTHDMGISSFDPKTNTFTPFTYRDRFDEKNLKNTGGLDDSNVISVYEDRQGTLWVGTNIGGLNRFDRKSGKFTSYFNTKNKNLICVSSMFEDRSGRFWVGTYLHGFFEFDRNTGTYTKQFNERSGALFNSVMNIEQDDSGQLWILSERGLSRVDPKTLDIRNFPMRNILPDESVAPTNTTMVKLDNGNFAFMLKTGIAIFDPKTMKDNPVPPKVHIESISTSNPDAAGRKETVMLAYGRNEVELPYNQNRIRFNYIGLHYDNPLENKYAYYLEGYDKEWVQAGTLREVTYTNLSPGTYTFHVKSANSDGVWSTKNDSLTVVISSPWWFTWWAYLIYAVLVALAIWLISAYRSKSLKRENAILEEKVSHRTKQLTKSLEDLKTTQTQLVQSEKMASLGELTAGIAHEIQNPLNFVNNFSEVSMELIDEMEDEMAKGDTDEAKSIASDIRQNLEKINYHGKRADGIVKGMLQHSRTGNNIMEPTNINILADEYLRLAYHGLRAKDKSFNADLVTHFADNLPSVIVIPQDIGRVLLNLFTNAFYATHQKQKTQSVGYKPLVSVTTAATDKMAEIIVRDNGIGIPDLIKDKIMQPFFTTKPTGEGTGLGLSLSYDIIVKGHGGTISIDSRENEYTVFTIRLPLA
jgi:signal transduction histidine kinase/ligand-binding sensor domain-containing protein